MNPAQIQLDRLRRIAVILCGLGLGIWTARAEHTLRAHVSPRYKDAPLAFDSMSLTNASGREFSVTRLDFLVSDFAVRRRDGSWLEQGNWQAYMSLGGKRDEFVVTNLPEGEYDNVRFHIGLRPGRNHSDPAKYAPDHPLNPNLDGLHWGWAGGYIFLALEGLWKDADGKLAGYSFHLANDPQLMTVTVPTTLSGDGNQSLELVMDLAPLLDGGWTHDTATTHSRAGDETATRLCRAVEHSFAAGAVAAIAESGAKKEESPVIVAPDATPYRFTFSERFPRPELPRDNPLTEEGVELGRRLFEDKRLSINGTQSCASCHQPAGAFCDAGKAVSIGAEGRRGTRNAMTLFNMAWKRSFFWDGRAATLREQVLMPIQNPSEMHESLSAATARLNAAPEYPRLFEKAFGSPEISADRVARALEQFVLTRVSYDSKFDRALDGKAELTEEEKRGFQLFVTEYDPRRGQFGADCFHCHGGPLFQSQSFANNGLDSQFSDTGRGQITGRAGDVGRFAVPSLRNVELTGPYMHDGRFSTLEEVVAHYCTGTKRSATLDPNLAKHPDGGAPLSTTDQRALVAFLKTLTDESLRTRQAAQ